MDQLALLGGTPVLEQPYPIHNPLGEEEKQAVIEVMDKKIISDFIGRAGDKFCGGEYVLAFEKLMCDMFSVEYSVSFNSATTALQAAVTAAGVGPGDEVITSPYTMSATASAILLNNAIPVFADIEDDTYCLNPKEVEKLITERTKAILVVNIFGGSARYDELLAIAQKYSLIVIEDNAQAIGGTYKGQHLGTIGDIGVFSFNVHKHIQCGEGGVLVTNNNKYAQRAQLVRNHGEVVMDDLVSAGEDFYPIVGSNYRLSELHAAVAIEQLKKMEKLNKTRVDLALYLSEQLQHIDWINGAYILPETRHVFYVYPMKFIIENIGISRRVFAEAMKAEGFPINEGYVKPLYLMPVYQKKRMFPHSQFPFVSTEYLTDVSYDKGICPVTDRLFDEDFIFTGICHHPRTKEDMDLFIQAIKKIEYHIDALKKYETEAT
ncbi:DegT/DnrJ/EryC1/StrS family aminotransferase [Patescibacteria group bacterium]|nr:DegT/DnrJ/EryC1/StrS family aminotransferase [Patescibacteria group bacterium]MBU1722105.1 DegT/DnrJ/EryC1/StrS family aminotransferase [Patescibacteria group bacterium]MBU1901595.1 DegT/DnrJ/EryC1/StrS family aminotransferase [Patescibacteria group bacterium]